MINLNDKRFSKTLDESIKLCNQLVSDSAILCRKVCILTEQVEELEKYRTNHKNTDT